MFSSYNALTEVILKKYSVFLYDLYSFINFLKVNFFEKLYKVINIVISLLNKFTENRCLCLEIFFGFAFFLIYINKKLINHRR